MFVNRIEKFVVESNLLVIETGESYNVSSFISDINVRKDFTATSFPLVVVNMMTTEEYRNIMRDNDVSLRLKVSKYTNIDDENQQDVSEIVIDEVVFDTVIRSYKKPFSTSNTKTEEENEDSNNIKDTTKLFPFQIVGIPEELIQKNRIIVNEIYENARMDDILVNILSKVEDRSIFIDPSDNTDREESLIIPPLNLIPAIRYLQEVYGVYNAGLTVFFDFDGTYLAKTFAAERDYRNKFEIVSVDINDNTTGLKYTTTQFDDEGNVRLNLQTPPPFVSNEKISMDSIGQTVVFNSYNFDFGNVRRIYENDETNNQKTRYFWNQYQNKIHEESFINENMRTSKAIVVTLKSTSPNYFNINTLYRVNSQSDYANGDYIPIEMSYSIFTRDYKSYDSIVSLKLTKK
jgi:hypothetical protein